MESSESDEPEKKRPHLDSPTMARNSSTSPNHANAVDAAVLQYQNQKLVQQLDVQKHELHDLETKIKELKDRQSSYDDMLISLNQLWNLLVDDLILLGVRAGGGHNALETLDRGDTSRDSIPSCPVEEMFLCRLLERDSIDCSDNDAIANYVEQVLSSRHSSTMELLKSLEDTIAAESVKTESMALALQGNISAEDNIMQLSKIDDMMKEEAKNFRDVIDALHLKHKEYTDRIQVYRSSHSTDQSEIKRLQGDLEEIMAELEQSRRKLVNLGMQKNVASGMHASTQVAANGTLSPEKTADKTRGLREIKDSIEEAKTVAEDRLKELQDALQQNLIYSKQLQDLQNELKDDKFVQSSRLYTLLSDQLQHWNAELGQYKALTDTLQTDGFLVTRREKELNLKAESADAARNTIDNADSRIEELELQLQKWRNDIKAEFRVMASALSKEMGMMEAQLSRWKETAHEAISLRQETESLKALLSDKIVEIKSLKGLIEKLQKEKLELQNFLDVYGQEGYDNSLELRVKAANEAEAACQERLSVAEAEIAELRAKLDASERDVLELTEAIKSKDRESETYISEIETIGQAYEDMQTQNQHLLHQMTERDDYNIKLVSESVKTKQAYNLFLSEKQTLAKQLQQVNSSIESVKMRITHNEEQIKVCLTDAIKSTQEDRHVMISLETAKWELADAEKELKWLKSAATSSEKDYEQLQRKVDELQVKLDKERSQRKKLEEELTELNSKAAELSSETGETAIRKLQDEIKNCKNILKCGVCFDRPKEVVIVKCYHLFCNPCIQRNLEIRHRKCPGCGTAFGQNDVSSSSRKALDTEKSLTKGFTEFYRRLKVGSMKVFTTEPTSKSKCLIHLSPKKRNAAGIRVSLLEAPVLWAGRLCIYYALLKAGLAGSQSNPLVSELESGVGIGESGDLGFSKWLENIQGKPDKEAADKRKLVSKWHPTTKGTLKRNYRVPSKSEGRRLLKAVASLLSDDDHFTDATSHKGCQIRRESAHGESVCCNNVRALFDELPTPHLTVEITPFPAGPLTEKDYIKAEKLERVLRSGPSV
ncbi:Zinc finger, RING-type [Corchorus olitorius]|uniref:E3 ubiquitin protein ligase n=1 Tax=Corchorus olitorius TaxID=93759 RepID=A0A1R3GIK9_9ROSI|nr:Zinc finger, RING-type [Corchorus olitorius]